MILPTVKIDSQAHLAKHFTPYQVHWIMAEDAIHAQGKQVHALAEKSIRIGWTFCDGFKNVRKRLRFKKRDYLFATKDLPSALEYMNQVYEFASLFDLTGSILSHGEEYLKIPRLDEHGHPTSFTEEIKVGVIKFDTRSRIIAFSSNPQAMAVYGGDVGLDEFAKHPNAKLLWEVAQGRITWNGDIAIWSSHDGEDTLFYQFAQEARAGRGPWNLYYRVTMPDALDQGLLDLINRTCGSRFNRDQFLGDCQSRAGAEEIYQQAYLCNPLPRSAGIVDWSAIELCFSDYPIERLHLEHDEILSRFGHFQPASEEARQRQIQAFLREQFPNLQPSTCNLQLRLGFDVAASGQGDLAAFYIDEAKGSELWLRALLTTRTDDWQFLKTALSAFLDRLPSLLAAGDESGLGRQICWETASRFGNRFLPVSFSSKKCDLGFALMNQLASAQKRFPRSEPDIAADFFALRKAYSGVKWVFSEGRNNHNPASHCDIAWAGALASHAHTSKKPQAWALAG